MTHDYARVTIRPATMNDRNRLHAMQAQSMRRIGAGYYRPEEIEAFLTYVGTMDDFLLNEGTYSVAEHRGQIVGSGGWSRQRPNFVGVAGNPDIAAGPATARMRSVFVHPDWARRGIATRLIEQAEREMRAAGYRQVALNATRAGVPVYGRLGYEVAHRFHLRLPDGVLFEGFTMRKQLVAEGEAETAKTAAA